MDLHPSTILLTLIFAILAILWTSSTPTVSSTTINHYPMSSLQTATREFPVLFLSHAAPVLLMKETESALGRQNNAHFKSPLANWYRSLPKLLGLTGLNKPKAIVQFSAHYENPNGPVRILAQDQYKNGLLYDYYGFPSHTYDVKWPVPGSVALAAEIADLLKANSIPAELDTERGIDHGGFIPLMLMYPEADIPVLQISIVPNSQLQRQIGEILAPLRRQGIFFVGSGQATHGSFQGAPEDVKQQAIFVKGLTKALLTTDWTSDDGKEVYVNSTAGKSADDIYQARAKATDEWRAIPGAQYAHPRFDHWMPFPGCQGTTKGSPNQDLNIVGDHWLLGIHSLRSFVWGEFPFKGPSLDLDNDPASSKRDEL